MIARQAASTGSSSAAGFTLAYPSAVQDGSVLIAVIGVWTGLAMTFPTISDSLGNTWQLLGSTGNNTSDFNSDLFVFACFQSKPGSNSVTVVSQSGHLEFAILEYAFGATASDGVSSANNNSATTGITTPSLTATAVDVSIAVGFAVNASGATMTMHTAGYTTEKTQSVDSTLVFYAQESLSGSLAVNITATGTNPLHGLQLLFNQVQQLFP